MPFNSGGQTYQGGSYIYGGLSSLGESLGKGLSTGLKQLQDEHDKIEQFQAQADMMSQMTGADGKPMLDPKGLARVQGYTNERKAAIGGNFLGMQHAAQVIQQSAQQASLFPLQQRLAEAKVQQAESVANLPYTKIGNTFYDKATGSPIPQQPTAGQLGVAERNKAKLMGDDIKDLTKQFSDSMISPGALLDPNSVSYQQANEKGQLSPTDDLSKATHATIKQFIPQTVKDSSGNTSVQIAEAPRTVSLNDFKKMQGQAQKLDALRAMHSGWTSNPVQNTWREWAVGQLQKLQKPLTEDNIQKAVSLGTSRSGGKIPASRLPYSGASAPSAAPSPAGDTGQGDGSGDYATQEDTGGDTESDL